MKAVRNIYVGTSGWSYEWWRINFYPAELNAGEWLRYYAQYFETVEINSSFYHLPAAKSFRNWRDSVPENFIFAVKASRFITHMKKLNVTDEPIAAFLERAGLLHNKLGPVLFQLPPRWKFNGERLASFIKLLPEEFNYAVEFRNPGWWNQQTYEILKNNNIAFCIFDLDGVLSPIEITADFVYVRLHGPAAAYQGRYEDGILRKWAEQFKAWSDKGKYVYCYFDNDENGYAARDALKLNNMLANQPRVI